MILGLLTSRRPGGVCYLEHTLGQIAAQGWAGPRVLVSDGPLPVLPPERLSGWRVFELEKVASSNAHASWELLRRLLDSGAERAVYLEDDVELCPHALEVMAAARAPGAAELVHWFDTACLPDALPGLYLAPGASFRFMQALTIPRATLARLVAFGMSGEWARDAWAGSDVVLARALAGRWYAVTVPALVQHRGQVSAANPGVPLVCSPMRRSSSFKPHFDARDLVRVTSAIE